ncbi:MAG TPA: hypothetical protein VH414_18235 [Lichenihabitans sp.]|jgi:hypothetical protein|nr:hypothetical protein [Lichenihabitans sp.]
MTLPTISIANQGGPTDSLSQVMTGQTQGIAAGAQVALYDDDVTTPVGNATVAADGSWSTDIVLLYGDNALVARTSAADGQAATSNTVTYDLEPVLSPPSNAAPPLTATVPASAPSPHVIGPHRPHSLFVFGPAAGQTLITDFHLGGHGHDVISLPAGRFASIAAVLHGLHDVGGEAVIALNPRTSITVEGISAAELRAHPQDFRLHC